MKYQLLVFDWDGTLYDSAAYIVKCMQSTAKELHVRIPDEKDIRQMIGLSFEKALERVLPEIKGDMVALYAKTFRHHIMTSDFEKPVLFSGVKDVLKQLQEVGYWLAIATGKSKKHLEMEVEEFGLKECFMTERSAGETQSKPHPQMLLEIMDELGVSPEKALMIGDTEYDMQLAANAKVDALGVTYGVHTELCLRKNSVIGCIHDICELPEWLVNN